MFTNTLQFLKSEGYRVVTDVTEVCEVPEVQYDTITNYLNEDRITEEVFTELTEADPELVIRVVYLFHPWLKP